MAEKNEKQEYPKMLYDRNPHEKGAQQRIVNSREEEDAVTGKNKKTKEWPNGQAPVA